MKIELKIPNLGEAEDTEIIEVSVQKGEKIKKNDPIIVLESEKAAMEVPADYDGVILDLKVKEGDSVKEGIVFATLEVEDEVEVKVEKVVKNETSKTKIDSNIPENDNKEKPQVNIDFQGINTGPAVRKIARELGIDLMKINGTGKNNFITKDDVKNYIHSLSDSVTQTYADLSDLEVFGDYSLQNQTKIRKAGASNLVKSWTSIPHVTHFEDIDVSNLEKSV